ncbi:hypothetical protein DSO57_1026591 [Entomophthora muscae]|uniref:Uncharacterized protein n=1 Tax=Entomophthora muscae TaxID=34485 RepID=A0ACC2S401_9FUNG|nr:hypothetical protein DSO57_1026591 [Entomophthora muscae]
MDSRYWLHAKDCWLKASQHPKQVDLDGCPFDHPIVAFLNQPSSLIVCATVMNDISILLLKTQELNPSSQKADPTLQTSPGSANLLRDGLKLVNYSAFCQPTTEDPPKTTQVTQSGWGTANLLNCILELMSYSETCQSPKDNSPNGHQIDANLEPPKT